MNYIPRWNMATGDLQHHHFGLEARAAFRAQHGTVDDKQKNRPFCAAVFGTWIPNRCSRTGVWPQTGWQDFCCGCLPMIAI